MIKIDDLPTVLGLLSDAAKTAADLNSNLDVVALQRSQASAEKLAKLIHDLRAHGRIIEILLQMIEDGDSFAGNDGKILIEQTRRSADVLNPTVDFLSAVYRASESN